MTVAKLAQGSGDFLKDFRSGQSIIDWNIIVMMVGWCGVLRWWGSLFYAVFGLLFVAPFVDMAWWQVKSFC